MAYIVDILKYGLELDDKGFSVKAKQADTAVNKLAGSLSKTLTRAIGLVGSAFAAWKIGGLIKDSTLLAARNQVLGTVMNQVGRISGYTAGQLDRYDRAVRSMGITTQESRLAVTRMMQSQLDLADAAKLARVAQDLAVISGQNSSEAFQTLIQSISSQNTQLLRQYGIVKYLDDIWGDYASTIGKTPGALTQVEKKQALINTIFAEGAKVAGSYEAAMGDVGKQLTSLPRYIEEFQAALGLAFQPALEFAVTSATNFLKGAREAILEIFAPTELVRENLAKLDTGILSNASTISMLVAEYRKLKSEGSDSAKEQERLKEVIAEIGRLVPSAVTGFDQYNNALSINVDLVESIIDAYKYLKEEAEFDLLKNAENNFNKLSDALAKTNGYIELYRNLLNQVSDLAEDSPVDWIPDLAGFGYEFENAAEATAFFESKLRFAQAEAGRLQTEMDNLTEAIDRYNQTGSTREFTPKPLPEGPMSLIEDRDRELAAYEALERSKVDFLRQQGQIGDTVWLQILQKRLDQTEKFSEDYVKIMLEMYKTEYDATQKAIQDILEVIHGKNEIVLKTFPQTGNKLLESVFGDPELFSAEVTRQAIEIFDSAEERGLSMAKNVGNSFLQAFSQIEPAIGFIFARIGGQANRLMSSILQGVSGIAAGGTTGIMSGTISILGGLFDTLIGSNRGLVESHRRLESAIESWENTVKSQTLTETETETSRLRELLAIIQRQGLTMGVSTAIRSELRNLGYDPTGIKDVHLTEFIQQLIQINSAHLDLSKEILAAQSQTDFRELIKSGQLDFDQARRAIDYWAEIFDLTTEQQLELYNALKETLLSVEGITLEQTLSINETIDRLAESIENAQEAQKTQAYRSVTTITESQANIMSGILNTIAAINRDGFSSLKTIGHNIEEIFYQFAGRYATATVSVTGNTFYIDGTRSGSGTIEEQIANTLTNQIRAAGGTML